MCWNLFLTKAFRPATLFKKSLWNRCFPVNFAKFLTTLFWQNNSGRLLICLQYVKLVANSSSFFRGHRLSTNAKFSENLAFQIPWCADLQAHIRGLEMLFFREILPTYLMDDPLYNFEGAVLEIWKSSGIYLLLNKGMIIIFENQI